MAGCIVFLAALAYVAYSPAATNSGIPPTTSGPAPTSVVVEGFDLIFTYTANGSSSTGYLNPSPECDRCPLNLTPGSSWTSEFVLNNSDPAHAHNITAITIEAPFTLTASSPSLPARILPLGSLDVTITLTVPPTAGSYFVGGSIQTS